MIWIRTSFSPTREQRRTKTTHYVFLLELELNVFRDDKISGGFAEQLFRVQVFILIRNLFKMFSDTKNNNFMGTHFNVAQSRSEIKVQLVLQLTAGHSTRSQ